MFLPAGWLTPVLPPTEESTVAMTVVGTCHRRWHPRGQVETREMLVLPGLELMECMHESLPHQLSHHPQSLQTISFCARVYQPKIGEPAGCRTCLDNAGALLTGLTPGTIHTNPNRVYVVLLQVQVVVLPDSETSEATTCLDEVHAALVGGRCEASHVADDAPTQRHKGGIPVHPRLQGLVKHLSQHCHCQCFTHERFTIHLQSVPCSTQSSTTNHHVCIL